MNFKNKLSQIFKICTSSVLILFSTLVFSQDRTQNLGDVKELKIFNGLSVEVERSDDSKIEISGEKTDEVVVKNKNGVLKLSLKFPETFNAEKVKIKIYFNQDLMTLDANEGSAIFSDGTIKQEKLEIKTQEGAYIHVPIKVKYLTVKAVSGGSIKLRGKALNQEVSVNTGGVYEAYELSTENANVNAASGAKAEVTVSNLLDAKVSLGGSIYYKGTPEKLNTKKVIGGKIKNKG